MMVNFSLGEEMRNDVVNMSQARDEEKNLGPRLELNPWLSVHRSDALNYWATKDSWWAGLYTRFMYDMRPVHLKGGSVNFVI